MANEIRPDLCQLSATTPFGVSVSSSYKTLAYQQTAVVRIPRMRKDTVSIGRSERVWTQFHLSQRT